MPSQNHEDKHHEQSYRALLDLIALADMVLESAPEGIDTDEMMPLSEDALPCQELYVQ